MLLVCLLLSMALHQMSHSYQWRCIKCCIKCPTPTLPLSKAALTCGLKHTSSQAGFIKNSSGEVVCDRAFNVASLLSYYYRHPVSEYLSRTTWKKDDPNVLLLDLQGCVELEGSVSA